MTPGCAACGCDTEVMIEENDRMKRQLATAQQQVRDLRAALEELELSAQSPGGEPCCPYCDAKPEIGDFTHSKNCIIGTALAATAEPEAQR